MSQNPTAPIEWPTLALVALCYGAWIAGTTVISAFWLPAGIVIVTLAITLQSSLQHEILHGHPFSNTLTNEALVFPSLTLCIPYFRFRETHLAHHRDSQLTDPYDDPESNFLDPKIWKTLPVVLRVVLAFNNTLFGRLLIGPLVAQVMFFKSEMRAHEAGDRRVLAGWLWHIPASVVVIWWIIGVSAMPLWSYIIAAYGAISILKIRTFLEHRSHERASGRTVIIEDRGILSFLFLNNNLHVVHHMHPAVAWFRLPALYLANRDKYLARNDGYKYASYAQIFRQYFFKAKDPVPHPLWPSD